MKNTITKYCKVLFAVAATLLTTASCTKNDSTEGTPVSFKVYPYSSSSSISNSYDGASHLSIYIFNESGVLIEVLPDQVVNSGKVEANLKSYDPFATALLISGIESNAFEYTLNNTTLNELKNSSIGGVNGSKGAHPIHYSEVSLNRLVNGSQATSLSRAFSRVDIDVDTESGAVVTEVKFNGAATTFSFNGEVKATTDNLSVSLTSPITNRSAAIHYLYAAGYNANAEVVVTLELANGTTKSITATLPDIIYADKVYTLNVSSSEVTLSELDWGYSVNDNSNEFPTNIIGIDSAKSTLPEGSSTSEDGTHLLGIPYREGSFTIALDSSDPIELFGTTGCKVSDVETNVFEITIDRAVVGVGKTELPLYLRRKNLSIAYDEKITLIQDANPILMSGALLASINSASEFHHDDYIDGDLITVELPEGWSCKIDETWLRLNTTDAEQNIYTLQGGYKANDPEADGRMQSAVLTITTDSGVEDCYTLSRRNYGLPVVNVGGLYWSKFNLRGNCESFEDQVPITDPLVQVEDLYAYIYNNGDFCSFEDFHKIAGDGYRGSHTDALTYNTSTFMFDDYDQKSGVYINNQVNTASCPSGYQRPNVNELLQVFMEKTLTLTFGNSSVYNTSSTPAYRYNVYARTGLFENYAAFHTVLASNTSSQLTWTSLGTQSESSTSYTKLWLYASAMENNTYGNYMMKLDGTGSSLITAYSGQSEPVVYNIRCIKSPVDYIFE